MSIEAIRAQVSITIDSSNVKDFSTSFLEALAAQKKQIMNSPRANSRPFISNEIEAIEKELASREHHGNIF